MTYKESETIELKKSTAELKSGIESIVAILNKHGKGKLYFGIKDDGAVVGQTVGRNTIKDVTQRIVDNIEPKIYPKILVKKIKGKYCLIVDFEGKEQPYFAYGRSYMRVGESDKQMTVKEIKRQIIKQNSCLWELEVSSNRTIKDVKASVLREFMQKANKAGRIKFKYINVEQTLKKLKLLSGKRLKKAAEVLFCNEPFFLEFQAAVFAGVDKITFLDIRNFKGNIFNLRYQAESYIKEHIKWRVEIKTGPRKEIPEIPLEAIREAIGNSLCHRDFANPKGNEIAIFKDRIEIYNPGEFPDEVDPKDFIKGKGHSVLRNPLIAQTMYLSEDIEKWASGIRRIHEECKKAQVKVEFDRVKGGFVVVFYRPRWKQMQEQEKEKGARKRGQKSNYKVNRETKSSIRFD